MANEGDIVWRRIEFIASQLQTIVRDFAPVHLRNAITVAVERSQGAIVKIRLTVDRNANPAGSWTNYKYGTADARAQEYGSGPNAEKPKAYIDIEPKEKPNLVFMGTNEWVGQIIRVGHVSSPGIRPYEGRGYVRVGIKEFKRVIVSELEPDIKEAIKVALTSFGVKPK